MKKTTAFLLGGVAGAIAGLMFAPRPGDETRAIVTDWANTITDTNEMAEIFDVRKRQITHDAGIIANQASVIASDSIEKAKEALSGLTENTPIAPKQEPDTDAELRARIEEARARIASQVAENAARAGEPVPSVVEAAKDVAATAKDAASTAAEAVKAEAKGEAKAE
jgi:gas vesicle protein